MVISTASNRRFIRVFGVAAIFLLTIGFFSFRNITEGELIPKVQSDDVDESVYQAEYPILGEYGTDKSGEISKPKAPIFPVHDELFQQSNLIPLSIRTYGDPFKYIKASDITEDDLTEAKMCPKLKYEAKIEVSRQKFLDVPFQKIESALSKYPDINHLVEKAYGFHKSKFPKETQWLRFAGSSVWLNEYEVHLMVLRIYNSPSGIPNKGYVSFLYVQLYDRNWNELPPTTLSVPYQQDTLRTVVEPDGTIRHEVIDTELSYRDVEYPSILPIPFDRELQSDGDWYYGPEDPRMILRRNPMGFDEPLIVFNMKSLRLLERVMHLYLPFSTHFTVLQRRDTPFTHVEKIGLHLCQREEMSQLILLILFIH